MFVCSLQQIVSNGTFEFVVVNVLFVTDSPIDGKPCDELECCGPCVVFDVQRPVFELQKRLIAVDTWMKKESREKHSSYGFWFGFWSQIWYWNWKFSHRIQNVCGSYLWLTTDHNEYEYTMQCIYQIGEYPNVMWAIEVVFVCPWYDISHPCDAHYDDQFQAYATQCSSAIETKKTN